MPALVVFLAGAALMGALSALGPAMGTAVVIGFVVGVVGGPYLIGAVRNW